MPHLSKTASAAIAALVVATAATVASLTSSSVTGGDGASAAGAGSATSAHRSVASTGGASEAGGRPDGGRPDGPAGHGEHAVLFVGRSPELKPRGGVAKSFTCRAASRLGWACHVREGAAPVVPASLEADVVVVALVPGDDAARISRLLDRLPSTVAGARLVLLGPVAATTDAAEGRRLAGLRRLASTRDGVLIDPVDQDWITAANRDDLLSRDGEQLTTAGRTQAATRLANALDEVVGP